MAAAEAEAGKERKMTAQCRPDSSQKPDTLYRVDGDMAKVISQGEVVEEFSSSGCIYDDLGTCQGCPECKLDPSSFAYLLC